MDNTEAKPKFKLIRRTNFIKENPGPDVIQKNLEPLFQKMEKKKYAQEIYYKNHEEGFGVSPLKKEYKGPVHQRLGQKNPQKFYRLPYGTNTSEIGPKPKFLRRHHPNPYFHKHFSVQDRLNKVRLQQTPMGNKKGLKFRRNLINHGVSNLRFQVVNTDFSHQQMRPNWQRKFKIILNPQLQNEIQAIQSKFSGESFYLEDYRTQPHSTDLRMDDRFSLY